MHAGKNDRGEKGGREKERSKKPGRIKETSSVGLNYYGRQKKTGDREGRSLKVSKRSTGVDGAGKGHQRVLEK